MSIPTELNKPVYLSLQLSDGSESLPKRVFAKLRDDSKSLVQTFELDHIGDGMFVKDDYNFPVNTDYLTAQYFVYENDGVTPDDQYLISYDYFPLNELSQNSSSNLAQDEEFEVFIDDENEELDIEVE